jgi:sulfite reductase (NADPH) flavoprotein alpha-component
VDFEAPAAKWLDNALSAFTRDTASDTTASTQTLELDSSAVAPPDPPALPPYHRARPFPASLIAARKLNGPGSDKDIRHFEISLSESGLHYEAGDALGVFPTNCPDLVDEILCALHWSADQTVCGTDGASTPLRDVLSRQIDIARISPAFLEAMARRSGDAGLKRLTNPGINGELTKFLRGREVIDLLHAWPGVSFSPEELMTLLKRLQPRLYSISSSPKAHPSSVHLTVSVVRYESLSRRRKGVCSTFLAERTGPDICVPVFVQVNPAFRPPSPDVPMIMIGPGTGVAPFRAFLQEREATAARGRNWLFFGDQHAATGFLYRDELESMLLKGVLTKLDTAFSRDQSEKIYVQHRMLEHARELFDWLEQGAHVYVCGDANRMAKDVDAALHQVVESGGQKSAEQAAEYVAALRANKRYQRDVY